MKNKTEIFDVLIIGAGLTGITAGRLLTEKGYNVKVVDKGKLPGGRLATKRIDFDGNKFVFDYGAKFFEEGNDKFNLFLIKLLNDKKIKQLDVLQIENKRIPTAKYFGINSMKEIAMNLSGNLNITCNEKITKLNKQNLIWNAETETGEIYKSRYILVTIPVPQALEIFQNSNLIIAPDSLNSLLKICYSRTIIAFIGLKSSETELNKPFLELTDSHIATITNNNIKGIGFSATALTIEMNNNFSLRFWDKSNAELEIMIREIFTAQFKYPISFCKIHKWKFSQPINSYREKFMALTDDNDLIIGGDAFGGNNLESAYLSGINSATHIIKNLN